jgi:hypothetical protein
MNGARLLWLIVCTACLGAVSYSAMAYSRVSAGERSLRARHARVSEAEAAIVSMTQTMDARSTSSESGGASLAERLAAVTTRLGLPASTVANVSVQQEAAMKSAGASRVQGLRGTVVLGAVTLPQLGSLLQAWREAERAWPIVSIDVQPGSAQQTAPGADIPLRVVLNLENISTVVAYAASARGVSAPALPAAKPAAAPRSNPKVNR